MKKGKISFSIFLSMTLIYSFSSEDVTAGFQSNNTMPTDFPVLTGPYLDQTPPGATAELFARSIINTGQHTRDIAITPDGQEIYFSTNNEGHTQSLIYVTKIVEGIWTQPIPAVFASDSSKKYGEPFISPDGNKMYFISTNSVDNSDKSNDYNIWYMNREDDDWGSPQEIGAPINSELNEFFPSVTNDGTMYFTRTIPSEGTFIFRSRLVDGEYEEPVKCEFGINSTSDQYNAFISPDESYIIVPNGQSSDSYGGSDYYVCFRNDEDDSWSSPIHLNSNINSSYSQEWSASVSPDGLYLFFMSDRGPDSPGVSKIFWIDAGLLRDLNPID